MVPKQAAASTTQKFCSVHDAKLAKDMAVTAAAVQLFHGVTAMTCSYLFITFAMEKEVQSLGKAVHPLSKTVPRVIASTRGFFKVMVPTSKKTADALESHNKYWSKVFRGSFEGGMWGEKGNRVQSLPPQIKGCQRVATGLKYLRGLMLASMAYLAVSKAICATAQAINPHCKKSSKHKNKCSMPTYQEFPELSTPSSSSYPTCSNESSIEKYINLGNSNSNKLKGMAALTKQMKTFFGPFAASIQKSKPTMSSIEKGLKKIKPGFKKLESIMKPLNKGLGMLNGLLSKQVCETFTIIGTKKKCTKVKVGGKKTKKCVNKPTKTKKRMCFAIKDITKAAATLQKPLEKLADKAAKPIMKILPKKLPLPGLKQAKAFGEKMKKVLAIKNLNKLGDLMNQMNLNINGLKAMHNKLQAIKNGLK